MRSFGIHTCMWMMDRNLRAAEKTTTEAVRHDFDFVEIELLRPAKVDTSHSRDFLELEGIGGGLAMESFITMPEDLAFGVSVLHQIADSADEVTSESFPFLSGNT